MQGAAASTVGAARRSCARASLLRSSQPVTFPVYLALLLLKGGSCVLLFPSHAWGCIL